MLNLPRFRPLLLAAASAAAAPAAASAATTTPTPAPSTPACSSGTTTQAFAKFQDLADYALAPGGDFESGTAGWSLYNSAIVAGNETTGVRSGTHSLLLGASPRGGNVMAVSPAFCVTPEHPTFRFLVKSNTADAQRSGLLVAIDYRVAGSAWVNVQTSTIGLQPSRDWVPSAVSPLATKIPASALAAGVTVRLSFLAYASTAAAGGLQIDNLMIDPYRRS
ncbi:MAG: hypothetical protein AAGC46_04575 [Solirubrobacteraceae bacterium]|nr:hypothetical protein [Patulibacter sp.]